MRNTLFPLEVQEKNFNFEDFTKNYHRLGSWGMLTSLDLKACNPQKIRSYDDIKKYIYGLCDLIGMKRFGEPTIISFGEEEAVAGYSMTQLIETSLISGHFANKIDAAFIDIFSCKIYNPILAATFTQRYFEADSCKIGFILRD
jgi:S-adenosylmethionine/arginine decarboxylase-like enzyme